MKLGVVEWSAVEVGAAVDDVAAAVVGAAVTVSDGAGEVADWKTR